MNGVNSTYTYRPDGLRGTKSVNGTLLRHIWDGDEVSAELNADSSVKRTFTHGYAPATCYEGNDHYAFIRDRHGDVIKTVECFTESVIEEYTYDAYGNQEGISSTDTNPFRYSGEYYDSETGFIYLRARYYDSTTGTFISEDPARDGANWYAYCAGNPVMYVDPSGYITQEEIDMYKNGEMAPMAYSHLMNLTYHWYLADTEEEKAKYQEYADRFRANNYKTTNGEFAYVDEGIAFMPTRPTKELTKEQHYFRNKLNVQFSWSDFQKLQERLPDELKWKELPFEQSAFHKFGQVNNRKYVSACEHFEVVYTKENYLVDERFSAMNMGTYNYYGPAQAQKHTDIDVSPWVKWGNTPTGWIWSDWIN